MKFGDWFSIGNPNRASDFIASFLLDKYIQADPLCVFDVTVSIYGNCITLYGKIESSVHYSDIEISEFCRQAFSVTCQCVRINSVFSHDIAFCDNLIEVCIKASKIAVSVRSKAYHAFYSTSGTFSGAASNIRKAGFLPLESYIAGKVGNRLFSTFSEAKDVHVKTTVDGDCLEAVHVSMRTSETISEEDITKSIRDSCKKYGDFDIKIKTRENNLNTVDSNCFGVSGKMGYSDFYAGNINTGSGCFWGKSGGFPEVSLRFLAREIAKQFAMNFEENFVNAYCIISLMENSNTIISVLYDENMDEIKRDIIKKIQPDFLIRKFNLDKPIFSDICTKSLLE